MVGLVLPLAVTFGEPDAILRLDPDRSGSERGRPLLVAIPGPEGVRGESPVRMLGVEPPLGDRLDLDRSPVDPATALALGPGEAMGHGA